MSQTNNYQVFLTVCKIILKCSQQTFDKQDPEKQYCVQVYSVDENDPKDRPSITTKPQKLNADTYTIDWKENHTLVFKDCSNTANKTVKCALFLKDSKDVFGKDFSVELKDFEKNIDYDLSFPVNSDFKLYFTVSLQTQTFVMNDFVFEEKKVAFSKKKISKRKLMLDQNAVIFYTKDKPAEPRRKSLFQLFKSETDDGLMEEKQYDFLGCILLDQNSKIEYVDQDNAIIDVVKVKMEEEQQEQGDFDMEKVIECYKGKKKSYDTSVEFNIKDDNSSTDGVTYKFSVTTALSYKRNKELLNKKYTFFVPTERALKTWTNAIASAIIEHINKSKTSTDYDYALFGSAMRYKPVIKLCTSDLDVKEFVEICNSIPISISEKIVLPVLLMYDMSASENISTLDGLTLTEMAITWEVMHSSSATTMFRSNSFGSKLVTLFFKLHGLEYLKDVLGPILSEICKENAALEIDGQRIKVTDEKERQKMVANNAKTLIALGNKILDAIFNSINKCPPSIRKLLYVCLSTAEKQFPEQSGEIAVGGLLFLRFFNPAVITPHLYGLGSEPLSNAARTLTLLTKALQNIANQVQTENKKELFMKELSGFVSGSIEPTKKFLRSICVQDYKSPEKKIKVPTDLQLKAMHSFHRQMCAVHATHQFTTQNAEIKAKYRTILEVLRIHTSKELL